MVVAFVGYQADSKRQELGFSLARDINDTQDTALVFENYREIDPTLLPTLHAIVHWACETPKSLSHVPRLNLRGGWTLLQMPRFHELSTGTTLLLEK